MPPAELEEYYDQLERGANNARGDDIKRLKEVIVDWVAELYPDAPRLTRVKRAGRGIQNDFTGRLICPITYDWDVEEIRTNLRDFNGHDNFNINNNFFCRCFYDGYSGNPDDFEKGFLKSNLLVKTYKYIFTSPSSAQNDDNGQENTDPHISRVDDISKPSARKCVASILGMKDEVTPRSIAYTCVMLHFSLNSASTWTIAHKGFSYKDLWNFIVDFFEDVPGPAAARRAKRLLDWWNRNVFPHTRSMATAATADFSRQALRDQRNARE
ncbi:hypothetical protein M378DRAFT_131524 [Amanita muscaria Koide BX008]|uniref:Uncharacterized protein n=1 Tax=Amanita muscaria (strain Koide BX008) TaxID=946122 RepID=A0A0C2SZ89_AMAMK|nr:hypothetical protein M378DRAFT_131524 [Amanita muscaria Koide BX008]